MALSMALCRKGWFVTLRRFEDSAGEDTLAREKSRHRLFPFLCGLLENVRVIGRASVFLHSSPFTAGLGKHLRAMCAKSFGYKLGNIRRDLVAASNRWFDGIGIILWINTDEPQIDQRQPMGKRGAGDDIVEDAQSGGGEALLLRIVEAAVVDGAERDRYVPLEHGSDHGVVVLCESLGDVSELCQCLANGAGRFLEYVDVGQGIIAARADDEMARIFGRGVKLAFNIASGRPINGAQGRFPRPWQLGAKLMHDIGMARHVSGIVKDRVRPRLLCQGLAQHLSCDTSPRSRPN